MSVYEEESDSKKTSEDTSEDTSGSRIPYDDEIDEFIPEDVSNMGSSLGYDIKRSIYLKDDNLGDKYDAREYFIENHEIEGMPLEANKMEVKFLVRDISESTVTTTHEDADEVTDDILSDEPEAFTEQTQEFAVAETSVVCEECEGSGDMCDKCDGQGYHACPTTNCYNGTIQTECDKCGGKGWYRLNNSLSKHDCNECNEYGRVKQGQCSTCGGTPPLDRQGAIECTTCNGTGDSDGDGVECWRCNGRGGLVKQTVNTVEYSVITVTNVTGHQCAKDHPDEIEWEETDSKVLNDAKEIASLQVDSPREEVLKANVTNYDGMLLETRTKVQGNKFRIWISGGDIVKRTHSRIEAKPRNPIPYISDVIVGAVIGWLTLYLADTFSVALPNIAGLTTPIVYATPILLLLMWQYRTSRPYKYNATSRNY